MMELRKGEWRRKGRMRDGRRLSPVQWCNEGPVSGRTAYVTTVWLGKEIAPFVKPSFSALIPDSFCHVYKCGGSLIRLSKWPRFFLTITERQMLIDSFDQLL